MRLPWRETESALALYNRAKIGTLTASSLVSSRELHSCLSQVFATSADISVCEMICVTFLVGRAQLAALYRLLHTCIHVLLVDGVEFPGKSDGCEVGVARLCPKSLQVPAEFHSCRAVF